MNSSFPSHLLRYCPFCGADAYRPGAEDFMQCSVCGKRMFVNPAAAVACIIVNPRMEILLTRRRFNPSRGMYDLPGGFINCDEPAETAVIREISEELNLDVTSLRYLGSAPNHYLFEEMLYFTLDMGFECLVNDFSAIAASDDVEQYVFLPFEQIEPETIAFNSVKTFLGIYGKERGLDAKRFE